MRTWTFPSCWTSFCLSVALWAGFICEAKVADFVAPGIIPASSIEKTLPAPEGLAYRVYEDYKGVKALGEGILKGDSIFQYGNWYGPGWWGGGRDQNKPGGKPPIDELDAAAQRHDFGYLVAERMGKIYGKAEEYRLRAIADAIAVEDAKRLDPDPSKWNPPAKDPEKASRYRDRIITGFTYETDAYDVMNKAGEGLNWVSSPVESWEMSDHNQKLAREDFELHVDRFVKHWTRTNPSVPNDTDDSGMEAAPPTTDSTPEATPPDTEKPETLPSGDETAAGDPEPETSDQPRTDDSQKEPSAGHDTGAAPSEKTQDDGPGTEPPSGSDADASGPPEAPQDDGPQTRSPKKDDGDDSGSESSDQAKKDDSQAGGPAGDDGDGARRKTPEKSQDDGLQRGPPTGPEGDAYESGSRVVDDDGTEYKKTDAGWEKTEDRYEPITQAQKDAWDKEIQDAANKLRQEEAPSEWSDSDTGEPDDGGSSLEKFNKARSERTDANAGSSYELMSENQNMKQAVERGEQAKADAKQMVDSAGADAQSMKGRAASSTAAAHSEGSWGKAIADGVQQGVESGAAAVGSSFGHAAGKQAADSVFGDPGKKKHVAAGTNGGKGETAGTATSASKGSDGASVEKNKTPATAAKKAPATASSTGRYIKCPKCGGTNFGPYEKVWQPHGGSANDRPCLTCGNMGGGYVNRTDDADLVKPPAKPVTPPAKPVTPPAKPVRKPVPYRRVSGGV